METTAVISDIHGNIEAFRAVLRDIEERDPARIICLGDLVGYGPNPVEVVREARSFDVVLKGNHDHGLIQGTFGFNPVAARALDWSRNQIQNAENSEALLDFLRERPETHEEEQLQFVHASPRDPLSEYILPSDCRSFLDGVPPKIEDLFSRIERVAFFGHTHKPGVITEASKYVRPSDMDHGMELEEGHKYLINVGSVGQPRDRDPRACYLVTDGYSITYHRIEYDRAKTQEKIRETEHLENVLADRLASGT